MKKRFNPHALGSKTLTALHSLGQAIYSSSLDRSLVELVNFRVSQINGCAYCMDMHTKNLRAFGESEQRLYLLSAWRETPVYSDKERAALAWAEDLTSLNGQMSNDEVYIQARKCFSEVEFVDLTMDVIAINSYNRLNLAFGSDVGTYQIPNEKSPTSVSTEKATVS